MTNPDSTQGVPEVERFHWLPTFGRDGSGTLVAGPGAEEWVRYSDHTAYLAEVEREVAAALRDGLTEVGVERDELLKAVRADHAAKAAVGGNRCCCKWCKVEDREGGER
jgi:hypothetical protein